MRKEIFNTKEKLFKESLALKEGITRCDNFEQAEKIKMKQTEVFNKWKFYSNILKANDKIKGDK